MAYSYSQVRTYLRCPKQYEFASVKKVPRGISKSESYGSSIHNALKRWGELELEHQHFNKPKEGQLTLFIESQPPPTPLTLQTLISFWDTCFIRSTYESTAQANEEHAYGKQAMEQFFAWWKKCPRDVVAIEKCFNIPITDNQNLSGRFDRVERTERGLVIIDFKSSTPRSQTETDEDLQLSIYALAAQQMWDEPVSELVLLFISEEGIVEQVTTRSTAQLEQAKEIIQSTIMNIEQGDFRATPSIEKCKYCPYRSICPDKAI